MNRTRLAAAALVAASAAPAQQTVVSGDPVPIVSMGQPRRWQPYAAGMAALGNTHGAYVVAGVNRSILNPVGGLLSAAGEVYAGTTSRSGVRALATSPALALGAGLDFATSRRLDLLVRFQTAIRRGGLFGRGTMLRADWYPSGDRFGLGVTVPLAQPYAGRVRPHNTAVSFPHVAATDDRPVDHRPGTAMDTVARAARLIASYTNLFTRGSEEELFDAPFGKRDYTSVLDTYHRGLVTAFRDALGDSAQAAAVARRARDMLLADVIYPYNALFGQPKKGRGISGLTGPARARFAAWMRDSSGMSPAKRTAVANVHAQWIGAIADVQRDQLLDVGDTRFAWLPVQFALTADQFDDQPEVDSLIAGAVGRPFTDQNALTYMRSADLPLEIARSIYAARRYHVLWTHDFIGRRPSGAIDNVGYSMVADAYLPALTEAVKRYDTTGTLPVFMILEDQYFYEPRDGRLWLTILEDPLNASMRLGAGEGERESRLRDRQEALRAAVRASKRLQSQASRLGGDAWLRRVVKVHVSIVHPADFSFRSLFIIPPFPMTPDNIMREHRKIVFYDLDEADPYRGGMMLMGVGIGEHYASATWEDRGYRLRGPAALEVRAAVRRALVATGVSEKDIPPPLLPVANARAEERRMNAGDYVGRALQVHNEVGFGAKRSSVARAMLYNLAPPGTVIIVPDPLWVSETWAGMLAGAAARGCRVFMIAPAYENTPSPQAPLTALAHEMFARLIVLQHRLVERALGNGGELRIGLFASHTEVTDAAGRARELREGLARAPWIRDLFPFDRQAIATVDRAVEEAAADGADATSLSRDEEPRAQQLHQKTQLVALPGAIAALVRQPGWADVLARVIVTQSRQTTQFADQLGYVTPEVDSLATRATDAILTGFERTRSEADRRRMSFYFSLGTQNQDPRGIVSDGEATIIVSGLHAVEGLVDLYYLMARSEWITTTAELDRLVPPPGGWLLRIARMIRAAM